MAADLEHLRERLAGLAEDLGEAGLERLRRAVEASDDGERAALAAQERRLARARRAVEKASALLHEPDP